MDQEQSETRDVEAPLPRSPSQIGPTKKLNVWHVTGICYFAVSGGPFGFEDAIGSAGSRLVYLGLVILPLLFSVPIALMTAELATLVQETGGHVVWVERGLGPTAGFANSMLACFTSLTDNALYPVMFVDYLTRTVHRRAIGGGVSWLIKSGLMAVCAAMNVVGADIIGDATVTFGILVMSPFIAMAIVGLGVSAVGPAPDTPNPIAWGKFLTVVMWNTSGFDNAGTCVAEVKDPARTFPRAVAMSLVLVIATYVIPISAAIKVLPLAADWSDGAWVRAAVLLGGAPLELWMGLAAMLSSVGVLSTMLCATSRLFYGIATNGYLPAVCMRLHKTYETPYVMICLNAIVSLMFTLLDFNMLAQVTTVFYASSNVLRFLALWRLRVIEPDAPRPFKIPGGHVGMACVCLPPIALSLFACSQCETAPLAIALCSLVFIGVVTAAHVLYQRRNCSVLRSGEGGYSKLKVDGLRSASPLAEVEISLWEAGAGKARKEVGVGSVPATPAKTVPHSAGAGSLGDAEPAVAEALLASGHAHACSTPVQRTPRTFDPDEASAFVPP